MILNRDADDTSEGAVTIKFYEGDCMRAGLGPAKPKVDIKKLPYSEDSIPDIMQMKKLNPKFFKNSFLSDLEISHITFQVVNIAFYHQNSERLIEDIKRFDPKVLALAWCFSINGDVSMALRQEGIFAKMVMEHDLREITRNPEAKLDADQANLIQSMADTAPQNVFLYGYSGSGKTLFVCEALKIKLSRVRKLHKEGKKVKVIVTVLNNDMVFKGKMVKSETSGSSLMNDLKGIMFFKYLTNFGLLQDEK